MVSRGDFTPEMGTFAMAPRLLMRALGLIYLVFSTIPGALAAQAEDPRALDAQAAAAFQARTPAQYKTAATLWQRAASQYLELGWSTDAAAAWRNAGLASARVGADSAAYASYGRAANLQDAVLSHQMLLLLDESPLYDSTSRGMAEDARFVGEVNDLLAKASTKNAKPVTSAEDAQIALENLVSSRLSTITISCESRKKVEVNFRLWRYSRSQPGAPWERVTTDITIHRRPAAYDFRYRSSANGQDTTVSYQCADDCKVEIP
jgi:hypothetical protein